MGAVRWTGEAFKVVGGILTADAFEEWAKGEGKAWIERRLEHLGVQWFRGQARATGQVRDELAKSISSNPLRLAIEAELGKIVDALWVVSRWAGDMQLLNGPAAKYGSYTDLRVLPRDPVITLYVAAVQRALVQADEWRRFDGYAPIALRRWAEMAEGIFFDWARQLKEVPDKYSSSPLPLSADASYRWPGKVDGYYITLERNTSVVNRFNLSRSRDRRRLRDEVQPFLDQQTIRLAHASTEDKEALITEVDRRIKQELDKAERLDPDAKNAGGLRRSSRRRLGQ